MEAALEKLTKWQEKRYGRELKLTTLLMLTRKYKISKPDPPSIYTFKGNILSGHYRVIQSILENIFGAKEYKTNKCNLCIQKSFHEENGVCKPTLYTTMIRPIITMKLYPGETNEQGEPNEITRVRSL